MSTVVGLKHDGNIWIGSDSRGTTSEGYIRPGECIKVFKNKNYIIGYVGSARGGQIFIPSNFEPPDNIDNLPDAMREHVIEKGCLVTDEEQGQLQPSNFLIACEGKLYEMLSDFHISEILNYTAIGSGTQFSLGSFYTTEKLKMKNQDKRVLLALEAACGFDVSSAPPFQIIKV